MTQWIKQQLVSAISDKSLGQGKFKLASGRQSNYYVDMGKVSLDARGVQLIGMLFEPHLLDLQQKVDAVGGPALGAAPIVSTLLHVPYRPDQPIKKGFLVRRSLKKHGHGGRVEGPLRHRDRVLLVEDVTTSGNSILWAANFVRDVYECKVVRIISLLDRLEGAAELLKRNGYEFESLMTANDLEFSPL